MSDVVVACVIDATNSNELQQSRFDRFINSPLKESILLVSENRIITLSIYSLINDLYIPMQNQEDEDETESNTVFHSTSMS